MNLFGILPGRPRSGTGRAAGEQGRGWRERLFSQRRRVATLAAGSLAVAVGYHVVFGQNGLTAYEQKRHDAHGLEQQVRDLRQENDRLQSHVDRLQNDPNAIEHQAREELHYTRPGEVIVTLPADPPAEHGKATKR